MPDQSDTDLVIASGHTTVFLVINMDAFINRDDEESKRALERTRATDQFQAMVQKKWPTKLENNALFQQVATKENPAIEETGYLTGVFRRKMISELSAPEYRFDKDAFEKSPYGFSKALQRNFQFKKLMEQQRSVWKNWDIYIRPTMTGMFVLRFERHYTTPQPILTIARYTIDIQECFDIISAIDWLDKLESSGRDETVNDRARKTSVLELLKWLGVDRNNLPEPPYIPLQWQLALQVCNQFIRYIKDCCQITHEGEDYYLKLSASPHNAAEQLHDSFVVYHLDNISTKWSDKKPHDVLQSHRKVLTRDIKTRRESWNFPKKLMISKVRQRLYNLMEGALLRNPDDSDSQSLYFPEHTWEYVNQVFDRDIATWGDELCLLGPRTAIVMPHAAAKHHNDSLYISSLPSPASQSRVSYARYWLSIERLLQFGTEIRVLAQILENSSSTILQDFGNELRLMRSEMLKGDVQIRRERLIRLVNDSANLVRLVGLCHNLSNASVWSRAEFAMIKGEHLLREMRVQQSLDHMERNLEHISNLVDHIDELYLADLSEDNNSLSLFTSVILSSVSFSLILFTLPSFWTDSNDLNNSALNNFILEIIPPIIRFGTFALAPVIMFLSGLLLLIGSVQITPYIWKKLKNMMRQLWYKITGR